MNKSHNLNKLYIWAVSDICNYMIADGSVLAIVNGVVLYNVTNATWCDSIISHSCYTREVKYLVVVHNDSGRFQLRAVSA